MPMMVCHHCDHPGCFNPSHLFIGDGFANMQDMTAKGRNWRTSDEARKRMSERLRKTWQEKSEQMRQSAVTRRERFESDPEAYAEWKRKISETKKQRYGKPDPQ